MESSKREGGEEEKRQSEKQIQNEGGGGSNLKGKSCKGHGESFFLVLEQLKKGVGKDILAELIHWLSSHVPNYVGQSEDDASKDGRTLTDFYYGCAGYSVYVNNDLSTDKQVEKTELPVCVGLELLVDRRVASEDSASAPAHIHHKEVIQMYEADGSILLYTRNANLVASGVARNMRRVGNYIKESVDDVLYPYRRRPNPSVVGGDDKKLFSTRKIRLQDLLVYCQRDEVGFCAKSSEVL
ncbi:hypothetical protein DKX38_007730 [Salix brachista]|uniref:DUF8204 domain-containing protein n=1 Tax=Salix brachista TaxID=2182728 RepID=A0A5N5MRK0_9ROSI|nr:hypothetical protein DKX38_007730 [Salix brachista]